jgi:transcriptional regulator with XRE-family HTH domain
MRPQRKELHVDDKARGTFAGIIGSLRSERLDAGLSQNALAWDLPFRGRAISEWETGAVDPTLAHLMQWSRALGMRLVLLTPNGQPLNSLLRPRPGESWEKFERRRLATQIRNRRIARGMSQSAVGEIVGVSRDSIQRWELVYVPPRPIAHVVWAQAHDFTLGLGPMLYPDRTQRLSSRTSHVHSASRVRVL